MMDEALRMQVRSARGKFAAMAATYCLGVFNDSFFRTAAMIMAVYAGRAGLQGYIMVIFTLPYLLFAAPAGWLADRFSKRRVVIGAKVLELAAMICGAAGIMTFSWPLILVMAFIMGLQSCLFSPALNGSIPELYPPEYVLTANAVLKMVVTVAILAGVATSGLALPVKSPAPGGVPLGRWLVAAVVVGISGLGVLGSLGVPRRPSADPAARFPWFGPVQTLRELRAMGRDRLLATVVAADVFPWFAGSAIIPLVNVMAKEQFGLSEDMAGLLLGAEVVGVAVGGLIGSRVATGPRWYRVLPPAALAMAVLMGATAAVPLAPTGMQVPAVFALLGAMGLAGGAFLVPCESFIQVRPDPRRKGAVIAAANFAVFAGIMVSGPAANALNKVLLPTTSFAVLAGVALLTAAALLKALPKKDRP